MLLAGRRPHRGCLAVAELSLDQLVAWGALYYAYSVLSVPIADGLDVAPAVVAAGFSFALLVSGLAAAPVGRILDRHGARPVLRAGAVIGPSALVLLAIANGPFTLFAAFGLLGIAHASSLYEPAIRAIIGWFPRPRARGRALLALTSVAGLASTMFLPLTALLVDRLGFRGALLLLGGLVAVVAGWVAARLPTSPPARGGRKSGSGFARPSLALAGEGRANPSRAQLVWSTPSLLIGPTFGRTRSRPTRAAVVAPRSQRRAQYLLTAGFALQSFASTALSVALVWFLVERGSSLATAAALAGLAGAAQVPGRIVLGPLQRRVSARARVPILFAVQAAAVAAIASAPPSLLSIAIFVFGVAAGTMTLERPAILLEWFGDAGFGARSGAIAGVSAFARATSPYGVEALRGTLGYSTAFRGLALVLAAGGLAVLAAGASRDPKRGPPSQGASGRAPLVASSPVEIRAARARTLWRGPSDRGRGARRG